jgi:hypothetical protein
MRISVLFAAAATAVVLSASVSAPALADAKGEFQKGCTSGGGSYGEDVNGVFCNSSGGVHIACNDSITHCTATSYTDKPKKPFGPPLVRQLGTSVNVGTVQTPPSGPKFGGQTLRPLALGATAGARRLR